MSPTTDWRDYAIYYYPPQCLVGTAYDALWLTLDLINNNGLDASNATIMLDSVNIESFTLP